MRTGGNFKIGPFELMDLIGIDVNFAVTKSVYDAFFGEPRYRPHPIQERMVDAGTLGRKTGRGFYSYGDGNTPSHSRLTTSTSPEADVSPSASEADVSPSASEQDNRGGADAER
jgi:3-hydroxybutyryl-CoA dehydrogenase